MTELVDDILFLSELEQGREVVALGETEAAPVLRDVVAERSERAETAGIRLELRVADEAIRVPLRRRMLRTVAENLVENAIRYAGEGATCVVSLRTEDGQIVLEVADDGAGVPEEDAARLFERFFRSDRARHHPRERSRSRDRQACGRDRGRARRSPRRERPRARRALRAAKRPSCAAWRWSCVPPWSTTAGSLMKSSGRPYDWPLVTAQSMNVLRAGALSVLSGTITQVNVQIG